MFALFVERNSVWVPPRAAWSAGLPPMEEAVNVAGILGGNTVARLVREMPVPRLL